MSKVIGIQEKDFFDLVEKLNEFNELENVKATQVFQKDDWYAIVYYEEKIKNEYPIIPKSENIPASQKAKDLLKKLGYKGDISKLNKRQVWLETKKLKEK